MKMRSGKIELANVLFRSAFLIAILVLLFVGGCTTPGGSQPQPVTVPEIIQLSREGVPPQDIIQQIRESGTVYRLNASQLADLRDEGVSDLVINYMQQTYLNAVTRDQALSDWQYWHSGGGGYWYGGIPFGWPYGPEFYVPVEPREGRERFERREGVERHEELEERERGSGEGKEGGEERERQGEEH